MTIDRDFMEKSPELRKRSSMKFASKHLAVRANPEEARKLQRISKEVSKNRLLTENNGGAEMFEHLTHRYFND